MRVVLFTTDEPLYLPAYLGPILAAHADAIDRVVVVPFEEGTLSATRRQLRMLGPVAGVQFGARYVGGRMLDALPGDLGRRLTGRYHSVPAVVRAHDVPVETVRDVTDPAFVARMARLDPETILSVICGQKLGSELLSIPEHAINVHGSLLPKYRGRATAFWPLYYGDETAGVTAHYMTDRWDAGEIVCQRSFPVENDDTMDDLYRKTATVGAQLVVDLLEKLPGDLPERPMETSDEDYHTLPTPAQRREFLARGNEFL